MTFSIQDSDDGIEILTLKRQFLDFAAALKKITNTFDKLQKDDLKKEAKIAKLQEDPRKDAKIAKLQEDNLDKDAKTIRKFTTELIKVFKKADKSTCKNNSSICKNHEITGAEALKIITDPKAQDKVVKTGAFTQDVLDSMAKELGGKYKDTVLFKFGDDFYMQSGAKNAYLGGSLKF